MQNTPTRDDGGLSRRTCLAVALLLGLFGLPTPFLGRIAAQSPYTPPLTVQFSQPT